MFYVIAMFYWMQSQGHSVTPPHFPDKPLVWY